MRGVKNHNVQPNKYYIVSTDIISKGNYCLLNKEFNSPKDAQRVIDEQLSERKYYNTIINGKTAIEFGFEFYKKTKAKRYDIYKDTSKYIYPKDLEPDSQDKKSFRTKQRRAWRRSLKRNRK